MMLVLKLQFKQPFIKSKRVFILRRECGNVVWWPGSNRQKQTQHCFISFFNRSHLTWSWDDNKFDDWLVFSERLNMLFQINLQWICTHVKDLWTPNSSVNKAYSVCENRGRQSHRDYLIKDHLSNTEHSSSRQHVCLQIIPEWLCKHGPFFYSTQYWQSLQNCQSFSFHFS